MSLSVPASNSSASVALRLLTDAATRPSGNPVSSALSKVSDALNASAPKLGSSSSGTKIVLSMEAAERAYGAESVLMQTARGRADQVEITASTIPMDKDSFRSDVIELQTSLHSGDKDFLAALKAGKVTVKTVDEVPELNMQPVVSFSMYRDGNLQGGGLFTPSGTNLNLYNDWGKTVNQSIGSVGNHQFYVSWPKV